MRVAPNTGGGALTFAQNWGPTWALLPLWLQPCLDEDYMGAAHCAKVEITNWWMGSVVTEFLSKIMKLPKWPTYWPRLISRCDPVVGQMGPKGVLAPQRWIVEKGREEEGA
jgi:hypothetical protein